jgi:hypothetical protein
MRTAVADLGLEHLWVVYPGSRAYDLDDRRSVVPVEAVREVAAGVHSRSL